MRAVDVVKKLCPRANSAYIAAFEAGDGQLADAGITTPTRLAHFLAQVMHETGGLTVLRENMNYTASRIRQVWPSRPNAVQYAGNPEGLANSVYGGKKVAQKAVTKGVAKGATKTATKSTAQQKYQAGMQGAKQVQNTTRVNSALTQGKYRVPDGLTKSTITEVKNVKYQAYTSQLRDYSAIAKRDGLQFTLKVNNGAGLSGPLRQAESDEFLKIIGY
jgi:hypothetical protein